MDRLRRLAYNLRWSWDSRTVALLQDLAPGVWAASHNPVAVLRAVQADPGRLAAYQVRLEAARTDLEGYLTRPSPFSSAPRVAYFCAEFALAGCIPIYSGGLGVLAGDHLKAASDLGLPLVAVGLLYRYGYLRQVVDESGYQREVYDHFDPESMPLTLVTTPDGAPLTVGVPFPGRTVLARVWRADVGRVSVFLLDTELAENREDDRWITGHLYGGDQDTRIRQEMVLGIGGIRALRAALPPRQQPDLFHMNEGHAAFITLELARERLVARAAATFAEAATQVAPRLAFTTHTPVPAGHDAFPVDLVEAYFEPYRQQLGLDYQAFLALGRRDPGDLLERFTMTILALRGAARRNAVSQLHGGVSRSMWEGIGVGTANAPPAAAMEAITNGVHTATWIGPEMAAFFDRQLGSPWRHAPDDPASWKGLAEDRIDRRALWAARTAQRAMLLARANATTRAEGEPGLAECIAAEGTLVVGFARRFATYKRAALLLADPERLARLLAGRGASGPVVVIFAGKAHPRDEPGKLLVQRIVNASRDPRFRGYLVFLPNYDVEIARLMVQGCDIWLNTPRRPQEASGTSGMKATLNGALHLSELDGWWDEAYQPGLGWARGGDALDDLAGEARDDREARQLLDVLEREVVAEFYDRGSAGLPEQWLARVARSIKALAPAFSAQRMVRQYVDQVYLPAARFLTVDGHTVPQAVSAAPAG